MTGKQNKFMTIAGWALTVLVGLMMIASAAMKLMNLPEVVEQFSGALGYPETVVVTIGAVELGCVVLYLIPRTAMLGAVLLTGYLGGAIATHVRVSDNFLAPAIGGVLVWLALFLRDPRVRELLPIRRSLRNPADGGQHDA